MEDRLFKANEVVFRKGDKADAFYVVEDGEFVIFDDDATEFVRLFKGSCFGELALLREDIRTASVMAVTPGKLQRLGEDFCLFDFLEGIFSKTGGRDVSSRLGSKHFLLLYQWYLIFFYYLTFVHEISLLNKSGRDHFKRLLGNMEEMRLAWRLEALFRVPLLRVLRHDQMLWIARNLEQELLDPGQARGAGRESWSKFVYIFLNGAVCCFFLLAYFFP